MSIGQTKYMVWDGNPAGDAFLVDVLNSIEEANTVIDWNKDLPNTNFFITTYTRTMSKLEIRELFGDDDDDDDIPF